MAQKVLLLEDEPLIAMDIEAALQTQGFEVVTILSRADANAWLRNDLPDVAIIDVNLRDGNCQEVAGKLFRFGVSFIVHSGLAAAEWTGTVFDRGTWLDKPTGSDDIVQAVRQVLHANYVQPRVSFYNQTLASIARTNETVRRSLEAIAISQRILEKTAPMGVARPAPRAGVGWPQN